MKILLLTLFLLFLGLPVQAGIYKWTDEKGKVHYTQTPPPKEGRGASINTDTFNSVETVKARPIPISTQRRLTTAGGANKATTTKKKVKKRTQVKTGGCSRR